MESPLPSDAPLSESSRRKLLDIGIVSIERFAAAASTAPQQMEMLIGAADFATMQRYIDTQYPDSRIGPNLVDASRFGLGASLDKGPLEPIAPFDTTERDRLFGEAQRLRKLGRIGEAVALEHTVEHLVLGKTK
jgi:hypothetical protein